MKKILTITLCLLFLAGCQTTYTSKPTSKSCQYKQQTYSNNETFPAESECNECICKNGIVTCTEDPCFDEKNPAQCEVAEDCERLNLDSSFCTSGSWSCVNFTCELTCDITGLTE